MNKEKLKSTIIYLLVMFGAIIISSYAISFTVNNNKCPILKETSAQYIESHCYYAGQVSCEEIGEEDDFNVQCLYGKKWLCASPSGIYRAYSIVSIDKEELENYLNNK